MKLIQVAAAATLALLAFSSAYADCTAPTPPQTLPDGNTATLQQMLAGKKSVDEFNTATNAYLDCLTQAHKDALDAAGSKISSDDKNSLDKAETDQHNAAVDRLKDVADRFNAQIHIFKQKTAKS
jgi:hypothetical protein